MSAPKFIRALEVFTSFLKELYISGVLFSLISTSAVRLLSLINLTTKLVSFLSRAALKGTSVAFFSLSQTISAHLKPKSSISSYVTYLASSEFGSILVSGVTVKPVGIEPDPNLSNLTPKKER